MAADGQPAGCSIAMWGTRASGKTTFLASLQSALRRQPGRWQLRASTQASQEALESMTAMLTNQRSFPSATQGIDHYQWELAGKVRRTVPVRWRPGRRHYDAAVSISLELVDVPGQFDLSNGSGRSLRNQVIDSLTRSRGIIFLFDPVTEFARGGAFDTTFKTLYQMAQAMRDRPGERLPHYVALCITKFDEPRVFRMAQKLMMVVPDDDSFGFPRVEESDARGFFAALCNESEGDDSDLLPELLERTFYPDRIRYFATSAIGFYVDPQTGKFDPTDFQNHLPPMAGKPPRIRGQIYPINVVEPVLWLCRMITGYAAAE
jgi:hypothetical protein